MVSAQSSIQSNSTDVIAVGAGSSGSAVVRRLVDAGLRVTVLEAGPPDDREAIHDPAGNIMELFGSEYDWSYEYLPQPHAGGRTNPQSKGRTLDRSSAINGFIYVHDNTDDYNHRAALGAYGWDWASVEPYYCRLENYSEGGGGGVVSEVPSVSRERLGSTRSPRCIGGCLPVATTSRRCSRRRP